MEVIDREHYTLLLSECPCEIFEYYRVNSMHGLNYEDCLKHLNNQDQAYIWGWANYVPNDDLYYKFGCDRFVFINLTRAKKDYDTYGGVFHEMMHQALELYNYNMVFEEELITWAENETKEVFKIINEYLWKS